MKFRPEYSIFKVRILILIYSLLCILTFLFSRIFLIDTLQYGEVPDRLTLIVFFTIPAALMIVLGISVFHLFIDFFKQRPGSRFNVKLLLYFAVIVIFSIMPITLMTSTALNEVVRFWHGIDAAATRAAHNLTAENYSMLMERVETVNELRRNIRPLLIYYYVVFYLPSLLMTVIIAISFTRQITHPIVELTEATGRVAEGDFSIQIISQRNDELGTLIRSFNTMVQELEKSRAILVRNEKISIWQNMAQQLAHEIKNPLTPIKLSAERVLRRWQSDPQSINEILESSMLAIIHETEELSTLINEFRTLSKPMEPSSSSTILREPVEEVINAYSSSYPQVKFDIEHVQTGIEIKIDKHRLSQIITNLVINAIDAMNGCGLIEIRTDLVKKREAGYCRISVKDTGKGISAQEDQLIFTPYFTTKKSGTGLGLPIIERIVNDHDGAIWFDSVQDIGTTFFIDLPVDGIMEDL
jgi:nitrogen fixation/metabolism regulation signal transduction histidine kinase